MPLHNHIFKGRKLENEKIKPAGNLSGERNANNPWKRAQVKLDR